MRFFGNIAVVLAVFIVLTGTGRTQPVAFDTAADPAYEGGSWREGSNGGDGFGRWVFGVPVRPQHIGLAGALMNGGGAGIDSDGISFFLSDVDDSGEYLDVFRSVPDGLRPGQRISVDLDVNYRSGHKGLRVLGSDDVALFRVEAGALNGEDVYAVHDVNDGTQVMDWDYHANTVLHVELEQTGPDGGTWKVVREGALPGEASGTFTGTVRTLQFYTFKAGAARENALLFNNLKVEEARPAGSAP